MLIRTKIIYTNGRVSEQIKMEGSCYWRPNVIKSIASCLNSDSIGHWEIILKEDKNVKKYTKGVPHYNLSEINYSSWKEFEEFVDYGDWNWEK